MKTSKRTPTATWQRNTILLMKVRVAEAEQVMQEATQKCQMRMQRVRVTKRTKGRKRKPRPKGRRSCQFCVGRERSYEHTSGVLEHDTSARRGSNSRRSMRPTELSRCLPYLAWLYLAGHELVAQAVSCSHNARDDCNALNQSKKTCK
jgi:hypothetical protein